MAERHVTVHEFVQTLQATVDAEVRKALAAACPPPLLWEGDQA